jgi:hypothetical protein
MAIHLLYKLKPQRPLLQVPCLPFASRAVAAVAVLVADPIHVRVVAQVVVGGKLRVVTHCSVGQQGIWEGAQPPGHIAERGHGDGDTSECGPWAGWMGGVLGRPQQQALTWAVQSRRSSNVQRHLISGWRIE